MVGTDMVEAVPQSSDCLSLTLTLLLCIRGTMEKLSELYFFEFPLLLKKSSIIVVYLIGLLWELSEMLYLKYFVEYFAHSNHSVNRSDHI